MIFNTTFWFTKHISWKFETDSLVFGNIVTLMLLGIYHYWCTKVNLLHNFTYTAVADLPKLLLMAFSTIVIVFTVVICFCPIVIVVDFSYRPALFECKLL